MLESTGALDAEVLQDSFKKIGQPSQYQLVHSTRYGLDLASNLIKGKLAVSRSEGLC